MRRGRKRAASKIPQKPAKTVQRQKGPKWSKMDQGHKQTKRKLYTSQAKQDRIVARKLAGQSDREVGKAESCHRRTVARVMSQAEVQARMLGYRQKLMELVPQAIEVYQGEVEDGNWLVAKSVLEGTQALIKKQGVIIEEVEPFGAGRTEKELRYFARNGFWPDDPEASLAGD